MRRAVSTVVCGVDLHLQVRKPDTCTLQRVASALREQITSPSAAVPAFIGPAEPLERRTCSWLPALDARRSR